MVYRAVIAILMLSVGAFAASPRYTKPSSPDQVYQNDQDLYDGIRALQIKVRTKAQLNLLTPDGAGIIYYCSDCATDGIVVSTAATQGGFGRISARGTAIN